MQILRAPSVSQTEQVFSREDVIDSGRIPRFVRHEWAVNASHGKADGNFAGEGLVVSLDDVAGRRLERVPARRQSLP